MSETAEELAYRKERDELYYRERAVDQALVFMKQNKYSDGSVLELIHNANVIFNFLKGNPNE